MTAPVAPRGADVRDLHGERVADPYAWMADHSDPRLLEHLRAERDHYEKATARLAGRRERLAGLLRARTPATAPSCPWWQGGRRHQLVHAEGAEHPRLLRWPGRDADGEAEVLLDIDGLAAGRDHLDVALLEVSDDGRLLAYAVDETGDEAYDLRWRDLVAGEDLPDVVPGTFTSGAWSADSTVFFYTVLDSSFRSFEVWRHVLGTPVDDDVRVLHETDRRFELTVRRSRSGAHVLISAASRTTRQEFAVDAATPTAAPVAVRERRDGVEDHVEHHRGGPEDAGRWLTVTNDGAAEFRLLARDVAAQGDWCELVAEVPGERLESCAAFTGALVLSRRRDGGTVLDVRTPDGAALREILPDHPAGSVQLGPNHEEDADAVVAAHSSLIHPTVYARIAFADGGRIDLLRREAPGHDPERYVTQRFTVPARDGTGVPVTLAYARGTDVRGGTAPGLLHGYGAYEACGWPEFSTALPVWLDHGLVFARAHVRGGGEGGRTWWEQGRMAAKATTFTDYLDVAAALAGSGVVAADRLASRGRSAGGLLQGAVLATDPGRWRAMVAEVPFVDCVNSMLDADLPLTVAEWEEWGDPRRAEEYGWMRAYTPYENLPAPPLPALLVTGALHDPRVGVHEPAKWVAALRHLTAGAGDADAAPLLFRAEAGAGAHAGPSGRFGALDHEAEVMAFVLDALGVPDPSRPDQ